jgi:hypothetical protein
MSVLGVLLAVILEQESWLSAPRFIINQLIFSYIKFIGRYPVVKPKNLRWMYLFAYIPIVFVMFILSLLLVNHIIIFYIINLLLLILTINVLGWKQEIKNTIVANNTLVVSHYATQFFIPLFWFFIIPSLSAVGPICYLITIQLSMYLKQQNSDNVVYSQITDKMMFYISVIPMFVLFLFIAFAGNFEETMHYIVEHIKNINKSFYSLELMLYEIILIAISKDKFAIDSSVADDEIEMHKSTNFNENITTYITAILYRAGVFFLGFITIVLFVKMWS